MNLKRKRGGIIHNSIDIQVEILPVPFKDLSERYGGEATSPAASGDELSINMITINHEKG